MSTITRTYVFTDGTTAYGSQVESEVSNIVTTWNNHDAGTSTWTTVKGTQFLGTALPTNPSYSCAGDTTTGFYGSGASSGTFTYKALGTGTIQFTTQGLLAPDGTVAAPGITNINSQSWGITRNATATMTLVSNGASAAYLSLRSNGDILTSQLAPNANAATGGFFFLSTVAGTPTGVPTAYTGQVACEYDVTANKLWVYNGSWRSVALT